MCLKLAFQNQIDLFSVKSVITCELYCYKEAKIILSCHKLPGPKLRSNPTLTTKLNEKRAVFIAYNLLHYQKKDYGIVSATT